MIEPDRVRVETRVAVEPAVAFDVFTREIDAWWKSGPRFRVTPERRSTMRFEPRVGGRLLEVYDESDAFEHGRVLVWEPPSRLVFQMSGRDYAPGEHTEVEVRFEPVGDGTRVMLEHRGWGAFASDHPVRHGLVGEAFGSLMGTWWADLLVSLRAHANARHPG